MFQNKKRIVQNIKHIQIVPQLSEAQFTKNPKKKTVSFFQVGRVLRAGQDLESEISTIIVDCGIAFHCCCCSQMMMKMTMVASIPSGP